METDTSLEAFNRSPKPSSKHTTYFQVYDQLLDPYRGKNITFVEVGVQNGGSLHMWRQFLGPHARIIGIDLNPDTTSLREDGFEIFVGSQSNPTFWKNFLAEVGQIDVLLDDGGHNYLQQLVTVECAINSISDGGLLLVEDTHTSYLEGYGTSSLSFISYCKLWVDRINFRFSQLEGGSNEGARVIWSIEFFESIVAFKVNIKAAEIKSAPIWNCRPISGKEDFHHHDLVVMEENKEALASIVQKAFTL